MASILTRIKRWLGRGCPDQPSGTEAGQNGQRKPATTTQISRAERDLYWAGTPHTTREAQMQEWERQINS